MANQSSHLRWGLVLVLLLLWLGFAAWQWRELVYEREQAAESLRRQCKTAHHLLVSSMVSHRRMGPSFDTMVRESLEEIVNSQEIVAVGITDRDAQSENAARLLLAAGEIDALNPDAPVGPARYRWTGNFSLASDFGRGGGGFGGGYGRGRGRFQPDADWNASRFQPGRSYNTTFVIDRSDVDHRLRDAAWLRIGLVGTAGVILLLLATAWLVTVRLLDARARERILKSETDHLREMGQAAAGLAHETRNPLGLVRGWTQRLARRANESAEVQDQARAVIEECDRITARINQFLAFAGPCHPKPEQVDLEDLAAELKMILQPDLEAKHLEIEYRAAGQPVFVSVDREMFRQALFNLVSNAVGFAPPEGVVEITAAKGNDGKSRVEVADRGPGVSAENVESLFTPYHTTREDGTGLGLAIVRRIARAHGWDAGFRPRPGGGSIFWLAETDGR